MKTRTCIGTMALILALLAGLAPRAKAADASGSWNSSGSGNWSDPLKWTTTPLNNYPTGAGQSATIASNTTANAVITLDTSVTLGSILIGDGTSFTYDVQPSGGATITMNSGTASPATITKQAGATRSADSLSVPLVLQSDLLLINAVNGSPYGFNVNGAISESGGTRSVTSSNTLTVGNAVVLNSTASSYSGKTTARFGTLSFASIGNVGGGNSALGAPTTVANGTIDIGDGANAVNFACTAATAMRTDRILNFVGTTGALGLGGGAANQITYTSPFQFTGSGAKTLTLNGVVVNGAMGKSDLTVVCGSSSGPVNSALLGLNTYTNGTTILRATLTINSLANYTTPGTPSSLGAAETAANGTINAGDSAVGGTLKYVGTGHSSDRVFSMPAAGVGGLTLDASGYGKLTLSGNITNSGAGSKTVTLQGSGEGELSGVITDYDATRITSLSKIGSGTWTLKGDNSSRFTGAITINGAGGTLAIGHNNALNTGALTLTAGNLAAAGDARTLNNTISSISSFGFTGSQDLTLAAPIPAATRTLYNTIIAGKTLTLGAMNLGTFTTTFEGAGDTIINGIIADTGALAMSGLGTLTLKGANTYSGATTLNSGTVLVDYAAGADMAATAPTLAGGTLKAKGAAGGATADTYGNVTVNAGGGALLVDPNGGTGTTLTLGTLTATVGGGSALFGKATGAGSGSVTITTTTAKDATGIYPPHTLFTDGSNYDWLSTTSGGPTYTLSGYASYVALATGAGTDTSQSRITGNTTMGGARTTNTLKIENPAPSQTLALGAYLFTLSGGGLLVTGDNGFEITGDAGGTRLRAAQWYGNGADDLVVHQYNSGGLTISAVIGNHARALTLIKAGSGKLTLSGVNTFTGSTYANAGILELQNSSALGTSAAVNVKPGASVQLNGSGLTLARTIASLAGTGTDGSGALKNVSGANTWSGAITIGTGGARIGNADTGNALTLSGGITTAAGKDLTLGGAGNIVVSTTAISGTGAVTKDGIGTAELAAANTYTGPTTVNAGTLKVTGSLTGTGPGTNVTVNSGGTLSGSGTCYGEVWVKSGGTIKPDGGNLTVSNLVLFGGCTNVFNVGGAGSNIVVSAFGEMVLQKGLTIAATSGNKVKVWANGTVLPNSTNSLIQYSGDLNGSVANLEMANDPSPGSPYSFIATNGTIALVAGASFTSPTIQPDQASIETNMLEDAGALNLAGLGLYATDPDGTSWTWTNTTTPLNGTVVCNGSGKDAPVTWTGGFTYTPNPNFNGTNSVVVRVKDNTDQSDSITVKVVVAAVNDPPTNTVAPGYDPATTFLMDTAWTVTNGVWNDNIDTNTGYSGAGLTFAYQWYCSNSPSATAIAGATSASYTPGAAWLGSNLCAAVKCIDAGEPGSATGTVFTAWREVLGAANTPPVILVGGSPVESVTTNITEDAGSVTMTGFGFTATDDAVGGAGVTWTNSTLPDNGAVSVDGTGTNPVTWASFTYAPNTHFNGTNTFVVQARDAIGAADSATVTVVVAAVNDAPVNTVTPTYTGTRLIGSNLTVNSVGTWNDNADTNAGYTAANFASGAVYTYQWQRATNIAGAGLVNIADATNSAYTLVFDDKYKYLRVAVTCTDSGVPGSASATAYSTPWQQEQSAAPTVVTFNKTSDVWTNHLNWTPNDLPLGGISARIGELAVCSPATALLSGGDHAAKALYIATNDNAVGTLEMTGGTLTVGSGSIKVAAGASSTGTLNQTAGSITCASFLPLAAGAASVGSVTLGGSSYIEGPLTVASGTGASGTLTLTGNARCFNNSGSYASPTVIGNTNATGRLNVYETASFDGYAGAPGVTDLRLGVGSGSTGILAVAGQAAVSNVNLIVGLAGAGSVTLAATGRVYCTTLSIGDQGYGSFSMGGSSALRVSGAATLGNAAGAEGVMRVTGGSWSQPAALNIGTVAGATGRLTVADCALTGLAGAVTVGGGVTAGDRLGSVTVSNATFGVGAATVVTNGFVELTGTGSVFQCSTFTCRGGWVTNRVSRFSGGIDVTSSANTALAITNGGRMHLVFVEGPSSLGEFWGLRWNGNRKVQVDAIVSNGALTWDVLSASGEVKVFTNATHTMVGYVVDQMGTTFRFR